jgi:hypothetical protein
MIAHRAVSKLAGIMTVADCPFPVAHSPSPGDCSESR